MGKYEGIHCPICNKEFTETDDIVVCPECGAPHHRECYLKNGKCAFADKHGTGETWHAPGNHAEGTSGATVQCPSCGASNPAEGIFCTHCGKPLKGFGPQQGAQNPYGQPGFGGNQQNPFGQPGMDQRPGGPFGMPFGTYSMDPYGGLSPEEEIDGVSVLELQEIVGENSAYYLPRFKQMSEGKKTSWCWSGCFFSFYYFLYRKVYSMAIVSALISILIFTGTTLLSMRTLPDLFSALTGIVAQGVQVDTAYLFKIEMASQLVSIAVMAIFGLFSTRLYKWHIFRKIKKLRERYTAGSPEYHDALIKQGGINRKGIIILCVAMMALYMLGSMIMVFGMF